MAIATGKYLTFVDADDYISEDMYEKMVHTAEACSADCVVCNIINVYSDHNEKQSHVFGDQIVDGQQDVMQKIVEPLITPGHSNALLMQSPCNKLYCSSNIRDNSITFAPLPYAEDWLFNIEFFMKADSVAFTDEYFYYYDRTTIGSVSKSWRKDSFENTVWIQHRLAQLFPEKYTAEGVRLGVLGIQVESLRNYAYYCGVKGFWNYASELFHNAELKSIYLSLSSKELPHRHRLPQKCHQHGWRKCYCLWSLFTVKFTLIKHELKPVYYGICNVFRSEKKRSNV